MKILFYFIVLCFAFWGCCKTAPVISSVNVHDKQFAPLASVDNYTLKQLTNLALTKSIDTAVRNLSYNIFDVHTDAAESLRVIAMDLTLSVVDSFDINCSGLYNHLVTCSGRRFDSIYIHALRSKARQCGSALNMHTTLGSNPRLKHYAHDLGGHNEIYTKRADSIAYASY